jgi:predicted Zn-ribbon and HTH transcriptional regulator
MSEHSDKVLDNLDKNVASIAYDLECVTNASIVSVELFVLLNRLVAAQEGMAQATWEANRWRRYSLTPAGKSYTVEARACNACGSRFQAVKGKWSMFDGPGCPSCRGEEARDAEA